MGQIANQMLAEKILKLIEKLKSQKSPDKKSKPSGDGDKK